MSLLPLLFVIEIPTFALLFSKNLALLYPYFLDGGHLIALCLYLTSKRTPSTASPSGSVAASAIELNLSEFQFTMCIWNENDVLYEA